MNKTTNKNRLTIKKISDFYTLFLNPLIFFEKYWSLGRLRQMEYCMQKFIFRFKSANIKMKNNNIHQIHR